MTFLKHSAIRQLDHVVAHGQVSTGSLNLLQQLHPLANLPEGDPPAVQNGQRLEADGEVDRFPGACPDIATGEG